MKIKRLLAIGAVVTTSALVLAGCAPGGGSEVVSGTAISAAQNGAMTSMNALTATGYSTYNSNISYMFQSTFNYYDNTPKLVKNTKFGSYTVESKSPLTIKYTINDGVKWSDGTPVNASDMLLAWASSISKNNKGTVNFGSINAGSGTDLITKTPTISDNDRSMTVVYDQPYVDWEPLTALNPNLPAHIVWEEAGIDKKTGTDAQKALVTAIQKNNTAQLAKVAKAWNHDWNFTSTPTDKRLLVVDGPYKVTQLTKQYVTLVANPDYTWGPKPKVEKITVRFIPDQTAQVQALQNGEISVLYGQATADTVKALQGLKGVESTTSATATFEHVDLTFNNGGPFDPKTYGGDAAKALAVRQAFFKVVPRQEMLDRLIKPLSATAKLDDSSLFIPGQPGYDQSVANNGSSEYQKVDVDAAKALLAKAGVTTPITVRFAYANDNPRRQGEFQLIQASAKAAGFDVTDVGKPTDQFFDPEVGIGSGKYDYDATVFAYQLTSSTVTQSEANTTTGNAYNYQGYSNPQVDALWKQAKVATSGAAAIPLQQKIDAYLWKDASTLTLFQLPDVSAWSSKLSNVKDAPYSPNIFWNFFDWTVSK
ncbi:MAG: glutathione transport system substrate-binding protein [Microbacteriaceae bacterium]|nr:glutathione transport system substrate-binding protein [Microbacteriaceae bacterium]